MPRKLERIFEKGDPNSSQAVLSDNALKRASSDAVSKLMQKRASYSVLTNYESRFSPFRMRPYVETKTLQRDILNSWFRYYYEHDPYIGTAIDLHSEFPLSSFELDHEDDTLGQEFNDIKENLELESFLLEMAKEYYCVGECYPFGFFDDPNDPSCWQSFILLDPGKVELQAHSFVKGGKWYNIKLQPDETLKKIIDAGPYNPETGDLYQKMPSDIVDCVRRDIPIQLNPVQASHFKRSTNPFQLRGTSLVLRVLPLLMYRDKLRDAQFSISERHLTPKEIYKIGTDDNPADEDEIEAFRNLLAATWTDPNLAIVWHHALQTEIHGPNEKLLNIGPELDAIEREMLTGLMLNKAFLLGEGPTYANASVALDVLISRYLVFRLKIEQWMLRHVFAPLCRIHKIYKPTAAEVSHRIRIKNKAAQPWLPEVNWSKANLRDDQMKIALYERLADKGLIPKGEVLKLVNLNPKEMQKKLKKEQEEGFGPAEGLPSAMPGGPPLPTAMPPTLPSAMPAATPEEGTGIMPPESVRPVGLPGGEIA